MADRVLGMADPAPSITPAPAQLSRKCAACEEEDQALHEAQTLQAKRSGPGFAAGEAPDIVHQVLRSPGRVLEPDVREFMEPRLGEDLRDVRVHTDGLASQSAEAVSARAYTVGRDIAFRGGEYAPRTTEGRRLLAHELAHVVQQSSRSTISGRGATSPAPRRVQREPDSTPAQATTAEERDTAYHSAVQSGDWPAAAEWLNGFNREDIQARLAQLTLEQIADLHRGALDNPRVGSKAQVAQLTEPDAPQASMPPPAAGAAPDAGAVPDAGAAPVADSAPAADPAPAGPVADPKPAAEPAPAADSIAAMDKTNRLIAAVKSAAAQAPQAFGDQIEAMLQPQALLEFAEFTALFAALQATPAGWATDLAIIGLEAYLIGPLVFQAVGDLKDFFTGAIAAQDQPAIDRAGHALADALGILGVALLIKLLFHESGKAAEAEHAAGGGADIKPKAGETAPAGETPLHEAPSTGDPPAAGEHPAAETPAGEHPAGEAPAENQERPGAPKVVDEARSADGKRTLKILEDGECEVCASPCLDIREKYRAELTERPELAGELDDAARMTDVHAQESRFAEIEQELNGSAGNGPSEPNRIPELNSRDPQPTFEEKTMRGNDFDTAQRGVYRGEQVRLENGKILDGYEPGKEIVSRKSTQLAEIPENFREQYVTEIFEKYSRGNVIADSPSAQAKFPELIGKPLAGEYVLEVPYQTSPVPPELASWARELGVTIRDAHGTVYN